MTKTEPAWPVDTRREAENPGDVKAPGLEHDCPLCGLHFAEGAAHCGGCPMNAACKTICCPRCGYEYVDHSATIAWMGRAARALLRMFDGKRERS